MPFNRYHVLTRAGQFASLLIVVASLYGSIQAQQTNSDEAHSELWPELDFYVPLSQKFRLVIITSVTREEETREKQELQVAGRVDYLHSSRFVFGGGYSYRRNPGDDPSNEHRILAEQTIKQWLPLQILLSDRNREEIRIIDGDASFRYRNRVTLEREFRVHERSITPYSSIEVFHDSRFGVWNRNRLIVGVQIQLKRAMPLLELVHPRRHVVLEPYLARQNDTRSTPSHVHAFGLTLNIYF